LGLLSLNRCARTKLEVSLVLAKLTQVAPKRQIKLKRYLKKMQESF